MDDACDSHEGDSAIACSDRGIGIMSGFELATLLIGGIGALEDDKSGPTQLGMDWSLELAKKLRLTTKHSGRRTIVVRLTRKREDVGN
jgi:hypothetical protein